MALLPLTKLGRDVFAPTNADGTARGADMGDAAVLTTEYEALLKALIANAGGIDLLPEIVFAQNTGSGTADAVKATAAGDLSTAPGAQLITVPFVATNTGPMTLSINGETPRPLVTNTGAAIPAGYVKAGMSALVQIDSDGNYRLFSYGDASAIQAAAEAAAAAAEDAADRAQSYAAMLSADKIKFPTVAALIADEDMSYTAGAGLIEVGAGDIIEAGGYRYEVAASSATDHHLETAGGVKLYVIPNESGAYLPEQFGAVADGATNDAAAILKAIEAIPAFQEGEVNRELTIGGTLRMSPGKTYYCGQTGIAVRKQINMDASEARLLFDADFKGIGLDIKRAENLLTNPDFEDGLAGWTPSSVPDNVSVAHDAGSNSNALRLERDTVGGGQTTATQYCPVVAGKRYTLSADVKGDVPAAGAAVLGVYFYDASNNPLVYEDTGRLDVSDDYKAISLSVTAPAGAVRARCYLRAWPTSTVSYLFYKNASFNLNTNETILWNQKLGLPRVVRSTGSSGRVSWVERSVGVRLCNTRISSIYVPQIYGFQDGLMLEADGTGIVEIEVEPGRITNNKRALTTRKLAGGWVNENTFYGGKYEIGTGNPVDTSGAIFLDLSNEDGDSYLNSNVFIRPTLETGLTNVKQLVCGGAKNTFISPRFEGGAPGSVHFTDTSNRNLIIGPEFEYIPNIVDEGRRNLFQSNRGGFMSRPAGGNYATMRVINAYDDRYPAIGTTRHYPRWLAGQAITVGEYRSSGSNAYVATTAGTTGSTAPSGTGTGISDGGVTWDYYAPIESVEVGLTSNGRVLWPLRGNSYLDVASDHTLRWVRDGQGSHVANFVPAPASASSPGVAGQIAEDNGYLYICVATDTWRRVALSSW